MEKHTTPQPMWAKRLAVLLRQQADNAASAASRKSRAELRRGASEHTEHYAYPYVLPYADPELSDKQKTILVRLFALVAEFDSIPQFKSNEESKHRRFGHWANALSVALAKKHDSQFVLDPEQLDTVGDRLQFLHILDAEEALANVARIMKIAESLPGPIPALDYYDLFRTFLYWGNGFSPESQARRRGILRDYFSAFASRESHNDTDL